jgi:hypothetical protein
MDEYYIHENRSEKIKDLGMPTHTPIVSCQFKKACDNIISPLTFRWLIGAGEAEDRILEYSKNWLLEETS